jgi:DnaJ-class molecular chaperone
MAPHREPFDILGLNADTATVDEINAAFRKLALHCHPDKNPDSRAAEEFSSLKDARDRAIFIVENPTTFSSEDLTAVAVDPVVNWAVSWMTHMTYEIAKSKEAKPIEVDIEVSLEDVYHARTKKVVIGVLRADSGEPFKRTRQVVYVKLIHRGDSLDAVFPMMGDDPPLAILMGFDVWKDMVDVETLPPRSDVIVHVHVKNAFFRRDTVLRSYDLHADVTVSLEGRYVGESFELEHPSGTSLTVEYEGGKDEERQVKVIKGMGLPFQSSSDKGFSRGDMYVFMDPRMPKPADLDLESSAVRDALALLARSKKGSPFGEHFCQLP